MPEDYTQSLWSEAQLVFSRTKPVIRETLAIPYLVRNN